MSLLSLAGACTTTQPAKLESTYNKAAKAEQVKLELRLYAQSCNRLALHSCRSLVHDIVVLNNDKVVKLAQRFAKERKVMALLRKKPAWFDKVALRHGQGTDEDSQAFVNKLLDCYLPNEGDTPAKKMKASQVCAGALRMMWGLKDRRLTNRLRMRMSIDLQLRYLRLHAAAIGTFSDFDMEREGLKHRDLVSVDEMIVAINSSPNHLID